MPDALTKLREVLGTLDLDAKTHQAVFAAVEELRLHQVNLEHEVADQYIFWTNLTHELRTNLSGVIGFSELLNSQIHGELNDEQLKRLDKVLIHARQLLHLANDIIDLSKIKTNTLQLNPQKIDIQTFLRKFSEQLSLSNVELSVDYPVNMGSMVVDELYFSQLLFHLILHSNYPLQQKRRINLNVVKLDDSQFSLIRFAFTEVSSEISENTLQLLNKLEASSLHLGDIYGYPELSIVIVYHLCQLMNGTLKYEIVGTNEVHFITEFTQNWTAPNIVKNSC